MNYSHQELAVALRSAHKKSNEARNNTDEKRDTFLKEVGIGTELLYSGPNWAHMSFYKMDSVKLKPLGDQKFEPVIANGKLVSSENLETTAPSQALYFGAKRPNIVELYGSVRKYFEAGRQIKGVNMHRDVNRHQASKKSDTGESNEINGGGIYSAFVQTSASFSIAAKFANSSNRYGFVLIIDSRGADILELNSLSSGFSDEREFVFDRKLDPRRIKGAVLMFEGRPFQVVANTNYDTKYITEKMK